MILKTRGKSTSSSEVTNIGKNGFWILHEGREYYISFEDYPIFKSAIVEEIYSMKVVGHHQLRWKELDCDIEIAALEKPADYPLAFK
jgi:hypothetical protein